MLTFLKLGGSLITDKDQPHTPRPEIIDRLAAEIAQARQADPGLQLLIGHGSGSFGHTPAKQYNTRQGVHSPQDWRGFVEVWHEARALNEIVLQALHQFGLPVLSFPPSAAITTSRGTVQAWDITPIQSALAAGIIPLIFGDVIFDAQQGGTILSTEELFFHLTPALLPQRILIAGIETAVWQDFPVCTRRIETITPASYPALSANILGSSSVDVTGGMLAKVKSMVDLVTQFPQLEVLIFSGRQPGQLLEALQGRNPGTIILNNNS